MTASTCRLMDSAREMPYSVSLETSVTGTTTAVGLPSGLPGISRGLPRGHSARTSRLEDAAACPDGEPGAYRHATLPLVKLCVDGLEARR